MPKATEASITINGVELNHAQSMTLRVAVTSYLSDLQHRGLGDDEIGKDICEGYKRCLREIINMIMPGSFRV